MFFLVFFKGLGMFSALGADLKINYYYDTDFIVLLIKIKKENEKLHFLAPPSHTLPISP